MFVKPLHFVPFEFQLLHATVRGFSTVRRPLDLRRTAARGVHLPLPRHRAVQGQEEDGAALALPFATRCQSDGRGTASDPRPAVRGSTHGERSEGVLRPGDLGRPDPVRLLLLVLCSPLAQRCLSCKTRESARSAPDT